MQIIHWLLKVAYESPTVSKGLTRNDDEVRPKGIVLYTNNYRGARVGRAGGGSAKLNRNKNFNLLNLLRKRDIDKACFYSTLSLKRLGSVRIRRQQQQQQRVQVMKMRKETPPPATVESSAGHHVGNTKVLPISDATVPSSSFSVKDDQKQCTPTEGKKEKQKGDRKTLSKMKELVRWAAAARTEKGRNYLGRKVMQFRSRPSLKAVRNNEDELSNNETPKISFGWDVESCSTITNNNTGSLNSTPAHDGEPADQCIHPRKGNWITTDSEFVVLEL